MWGWGGGGGGVCFGEVFFVNGEACSLASLQITVGHRTNVW